MIKLFVLAIAANNKGTSVVATHTANLFVLLHAASLKLSTVWLTKNVHV